MDITGITPLATSTPEDAAKHIDNASLFGVPASNYKSFAPDLNAKAEELAKPTEASDTTAQFMSQSTEHASLAMPDVEHMSWIDRQAKSISDAIFDKPTIERKVQELNLKKMNNNDVLSDDDQIDLDNANAQRAEMAKRNYGLDGPLNKIPTFVAGVGEGLVEMAKDAVSGAQSDTGKILSKTGLMGGALALGYGTVHGMYQALTGSMYNELSNQTDVNGNPTNIDPATKRHISQGVGYIGAAIGTIAPEMVAEASPLIRQFTSPVMARAIVNDPAMAAVKAATMNLAKAGATMAAAGGATEVTKIVGEEMGKSYDGTDASFLNAIHAATNKISEYGPRVAEAAAQGFGAGVLIGAPSEALGFNATKDRFTGMRDAVDNFRAGNAKDVTPQAPAQIEAPKNGVSDQGPDTTPQLPGDSPAQQSVKVLQLQEAMGNMADVAGKTNMSKVSPGQLSQFMKKAFDNAGLSKVWIAGEDAQAYLNDPKRGEAARNIIDPSGIAAAQNNQPVAIPPHQFMELVKEFPEASEALRIKPDGPNPLQAKDFLKTVEDAHTQRQEVLSKLGIEPQDLVKPESNVTELTPKPKIDMTPEATNAIVQRVGEINKLLEPENKGVAPYVDPELHQRKLDIEKELAEFKDEYDNGIERHSQLLADQGLEGQKKQIANLEYQVKTLREDGAVNMLPVYEKALQDAKDKYDKAGGNAIEAKFIRLSTELKDIETKIQSQPPKPLTEEERGHLTAERDGLVNQVKSYYGMHDGKMIVADWAQDPGKVALSAENDYMNKSIFPPSMEAILPKGEIERITNAQMAARQSVQAAIHEAAAHENAQVQDIDAANAKEVQYQIETERIAKDPRFDLVDKFLAAPKGENGKLAYSIDPKSLTSDQVKKYLNGPQAKSNKVFVKGGISAEEAAKLMGAPDADQLLNTLVNVPRRETVIKARVQAHAADIARQVAENATPDSISLIKAFSDNTANHVAEMKFMREQEWPATKAGIKRIALPLPNTKDLNAQARAIVAQTKVGELSVNQFKMGERQSQKIAVNSILKNEIDKAFLAKESAALNSELQKEAYLAIARVNKVFNFARRFNDKATMNELRDAGKLYLDAANEILDVFKLNPSKAGLSDQGAFLKFVKAQVEAGNGHMEIPDRLSDIRQSATELSVEQVEVIGDRLKQVLFQAKMKNRLYEKFEALKDEQTMDNLANQVHERAIAHPDYDIENIPKVQEANPARENNNLTLGGMSKITYTKVRGLLASGQSLLNNLEHIATTYDQEKLNGFFHDLIVKPLKGDGELNGKQGESGFIKDMIALKAQFEAMKHEFGEKEFDALSNTMLSIPEFENNRAFENGRLSKFELMKVAANMGDPDGRANLVKMGVDFNTLQDILSRELSTKEVALTQNLVNTLGSYGERSVALQKIRTGQDTTLIKGVPWVHQGKEIPGGYFPQQYRVDFDHEAIQNTLKSMENKSSALEGGKDPAVYMRQHAAEMTDQGRYNERVGSDRPLDLSGYGFVKAFEAVLHDLNYGLVVPDLLKTLRDERIRQDLIAIGGEKKYRVVLNTVIEAANRIEAENNNYFADQNRFWKSTFGHLQSGFSVGVLAYNATSTAVQLVSLISTAQKMGMMSGTKHLANVLRKMAINPHQMKGFQDFAAEINPSIAAHLDGVENDVTKMMHELLPVKNSFPKLASIARAKNWIIQTGMAPMAMADQTIKIVGSLAAYEQFREGEAEGFPLADLQKLSDDEQHQKAMDYARQISRTTLTHGSDTDKAPIQKLPASDFFVKFWNDLRNVFNNSMSQARKIKWGAKQTFEQLKEGDYPGATTSAKGVAMAVGAMVVSTTIIKAYEDYVRGRQTPLDQHFDMKTLEGQKQAAAYMAKYMLGSPLEIGLESIPVIKDIKYAGDYGKRGRSDTRNVQIPIIKLETDFATAWGALDEMYSGSRTQMSDAQFKASLYSLSYISGGFPVNAAYKYKKWVETSQNVQALKAGAVGVADKLHATLDKIISDPPAGMNAQSVEQAKALQAVVTPVSPAAIPSDTIETIHKIQGKADTFSASRWAEITKEAPELGLTENGRTASNGLQQKAAMKWQTEHNAAQLQERELPVNTETLYGAHILGVEQATKLYQASADTKIKTLIGAKALQGNPTLENLKTVGQVRKAIKGLVESNKLTSTAQNTED